MAKTAEAQTGGVTKVVIKPRKSSNLKFIIPVLACLLILVAVIVLILALQDRTDYCSSFLEEYAKGKDFQSKISPVEMQSCLLSTCTFDTSKCETECPFGFRSETENQGCPTSCECALDGTFEGDIAFGKDEVDTMLKDYGYVEEERDFEVQFGWAWKIWNDVEVDGRYKIYYHIDNGFGPDNRALIETTIKNMSNFFCIDFEPRTDQEHFIVFGSDNTGCMSFVGKASMKNLGHGVYLPYGCRDTAVIQHEVLHALGFGHEQSRPDRDAFVDVFLERVEDGQKHNFKKKNYQEGKWLGTEYEITSGMQYESYSFVKKGIREPSITGKNNTLLGGYGVDKTSTLMDYYEVDLLYGCQEMKTELIGAWADWGPWRACSEKCGSGEWKRYRRCLHKETNEMMIPNSCGSEDEIMDTGICNTQKCPPKGNKWTTWYPWSECQVTCGDGKLFRQRICLSWETGCDGPKLESEECSAPEECIPEHLLYPGEWGAWGDWACGEGEFKHRKHRTRPCELDGEVLDGIKCKRIEWEGEIVDGKQMGLLWTMTVCDIEKDDTRSIYEIILNPVPPNKTPDPLKTPAPTGDGVSEWAAWEPWTECDVSCGKGTKKRERECKGDFCPGEHCEEELCSVGLCPGQTDEGYFSVDAVVVPNICIYGKLLAGRFDPDDADDLICVYPDGCVRVYCSDMSTKSYIPNYVSWEGKAEVCSFVGSLAADDENLNIFAADINGDGKSDLVCMNSYTGDIELTMNGANGFSKEIDWRGKRKDCTSPKIIEMADLTGDGKADLVCGDDAIKVMYKSTCD